MVRRKKVLSPQDMADIANKDIVEQICKDFDISDIEGIGPIKKKRLEAAGMKTALDIIIMGSQEIHQVTDMKKEEAVALVDKIRLQLEQAEIIPRLESATDVNNWHKKIITISTGSEPFDMILHGGISSQGITEVYGPDGAGKTQLSNTVTVNALSKGLAVFYIDCEGTFSLDRLIEIAKTRDIYKDDLFDKLYYSRTLDSDTVEKAVSGMVKKIINDKISLIVVDGAPGLFRSEYDKGQAELGVRQNDIKPLLRHLRNIAEYLNVAVLMTNQVIGDPNGKFTGEPFKAVGGYIVSHPPKYIIRLNKAYNTKRAARLVKCPFHAMADVVFYLNAEGISDYEDLSKKKKPEVPPISKELEDELVNGTTV